MSWSLNRISLMANDSAHLFNLLTAWEYSFFGGNVYRDHLPSFCLIRYVLDIIKQVEIAAFILITLIFRGSTVRRKTPRKV